jgi:hypothetical protein
MPDLEQQLQRFATAVLDDVEPVTVAEVAGMRRRRPGLVVVAVGVAAAVALVAAVLVVRRQDTEELNLVGPGSTTGWVGALAAVPDTPETRSSIIRLEDIGRARALTGRPVLGPEASDDQVAGEEFLLLGGNSTSFFLNSVPAELRAELGFDSREADQVLEWGNPPGRMTVLRGRFDRAAIATAVETDRYWSGLLEEREYGGVSFWSWGADYALNTVFSPIRGAGNSARLALVDDRVLWTAGDPELEATIDALYRRRPSLADDPDWRLAAEVADERSLVAGRFTGREVPHGLCMPAPCDPPPLPEAAAPIVSVSGWTTRAEGGNRFVVILVYPSEAEAEAAVDPVRRTMEEMREAFQTPPADPTFEVDGRVLVVDDSGMLLPPP